MLESLLLVLSLCVDACVASFAYGTNKIKIPLVSGIVLTAISTFFLLISISCGHLLSNLLPKGFTPIFSFLVLFLLGIVQLFEGLLKNYLNKKALSPSNIEVTLFNFKLVLNVYTDVTLADLDHSKTLSPKEALYLGTALSFDSLAVGLGIGLLPISLIQVTFLSIACNLFAIYLGCFLGNSCAKKSEIDLSWMSGFILILLALLKL